MQVFCKRLLSLTWQVSGEISHFFFPLLKRVEMLRAAAVIAEDAGVRRTWVHLDLIGNFLLTNLAIAWLEAYLLLTAALLRV
jgi:hypothetical protein